jgi:WD repeat-containing protein 42A
MILKNSFHLQEVNFFGPNDEYVVSGDDFGYLWVWDAESGVLGPDPERVVNVDEDTKPYEFLIDVDSRCPCRPLNAVYADSTVCNGVVPHPYLPVLASYGIDSTVKIWGTPYSLNMNHHKDRDELIRSARQNTSRHKKKLPSSGLDLKYVEQIVLEELQYLISMGLDVVNCIPYF